MEKASRRRVQTHRFARLVVSRSNVAATPLVELDSTRDLLDGFVVFPTLLELPLGAGALHSFPLGDVRIYRFDDESQFVDVVALKFLHGRPVEHDRIPRD
jgi:hypothetical protein